MTLGRQAGVRFFWGKMLITYDDESEAFVDLAHDLFSSHLSTQTQVQQKPIKMGLLVISCAYFPRAKGGARPEGALVVRRVRVRRFFEISY